MVMQRYIGHKPQDITPAQLLEVAKVISYGGVVGLRMRQELGLAI